MSAESADALPEITPLEDARSSRPVDAVGVGEFWYEPEIWAAPVSPAARVLYAGLCSFVPNAKINRKDLRNTLEGSPDAEISHALNELVETGLLRREQLKRGNNFYTGYVVEPVTS